MAGLLLQCTVWPGVLLTVGVIFSTRTNTFYIPSTSATSAPCARNMSIMNKYTLELFRLDLIKTPYKGEQVDRVHASKYNSIG